MKYTPKRLNIIYQSLYDGDSKVESARKAGITYKVFWTWYNEKKEFRDKVDEIILDKEETIKHEAINAIISNFKNNPGCAMWFLERKFPNEYAKKDKLDITTTEKKIIFQIGLNQSEETPNITITGEDQKLIDNE